jgi:hypothetical protein
MTGHIALRVQLGGMQLVHRDAFTGRVSHWSLYRAQEIRGVAAIRASLLPDRKRSSWCVSGAQG